MAQSKKLTPELYFPCANCGKWRRQHVGKERKCLFEASLFEPKKPQHLTARQRTMLLDRIALLQVQLVDFPRKELDWLDTQVDHITTAATAGCSHKNDEGGSLVENVGRENELIGPRKKHSRCSLCGEDWYE